VLRFYANTTPFCIKRLESTDFRIHGDAGPNPLLIPKKDYVIAKVDGLPEWWTWKLS
jgi:hypothetical protein